MTQTPDTAAVAQTTADTATEQAQTAAAGNSELRVVNGVTMPAPGTYTLDPTHTRIGFVARHLMVTKVRGSFREFTGTLRIGADHSSSTAEATLATKSIDTGTADRDAHLISGDFLDVEKFPTITFTNAKVTAVKGAEATVVGDLTIKDVTKPVTVQVEIDGVAKDPWGNEKLAFSARTEIDREEFGITWNVALETGGVLVSKKVTIEIEGQAARNA